MRDAELGVKIIVLIRHAAVPLELASELDPMVRDKTLKLDPPCDASGGCQFVVLAELPTR